MLQPVGNEGVLALQVAANFDGIGIGSWVAAAHDRESWWPALVKLQ
jgi:hypothetical protein